MPSSVPLISARRLLLAGASIAAIGLGAAPARAGGPRVFSPAWFAARVDASTGANLAAGGSPAASLAQVTQAQANLATVAQRLAAIQQSEQAAASAAASAASSVPNGLVLGGLQVAPGATPGSALWQGANLPAESAGANGTTAVTVQQTAPAAILTWQTFSVGAKTALTFNQTAGGSLASTWVVLNRVEDPSANPAQILGGIDAVGKVYIIDGNGVVFGAGSQINLGALIASTADIANAQFTSGIYGAQSGNAFLPTFTGATPTSAIVVDEGASITTAAPASVTALGGYVMLLGGQVTNSGEITTPSGQTILAAGQDFVLRSGYSTTGNQTATVEGSQIATCYDAGGVCGSAAGGAWASPGAGGTATNAGLITAATGDITLAGHDVVQGGVALSTTSVDLRGTIHLLTSSADATATVTLLPGSVTDISPDQSGATALDSQRTQLIAQSAANNALRAQDATGNAGLLNDVSFVPDALYQSRVEIVTGGNVAFDGGSVTTAAGGQLAVQAGLQVWVGSGAQLDVSGATSAVLPMTINNLVVNIQGNELRDAPVNRDTGLITSATVNVDARTLVPVAAGVNGYPNARDYTEGGLLEVSGYVSNVGHTIEEWLAPGGTITFAAGNAPSGTTPSGGAVVTQPGAVLNVAGGSVTVNAGYMPQSYLIGPGGVLYNVDTAPSTLLYSGVYSPFTVNYQRFGGSDSYVSLVAAPAQIFETGYTYGRDAGSVVVQTQSAVLEGTIDASVTNGVQQTAARPASLPNNDPYELPQATIAEPGTLDVTGYSLIGAGAFNAAVEASGNYVPLAGTIAAGGTLPASAVSVVQFSAAQISAEALGGLVLNAGTAAVTVSGPLDLAAGGTLALSGADIAIDSNLAARGGAITLADTVVPPGQSSPVILQPASGTGALSVAPGVVFDLRGLFTNVGSDTANVAGEGLVNGGNLKIDSFAGLSIGSGVTFDASSGGALLASLATIGGKGGNISIAGDDPSQTVNESAPPAAPVAFAAVLRDVGVAGGGTLALTLPSVVIGGGVTAAANGTVLDPSLFQDGFSDYVINGFTALTVAPGTNITVTEPIYTFFNAGTTLPTGAPTGSDPASVFQTVLEPLYETNAATASLTQRRGASLSLISNFTPGQQNNGGGGVDLGAGSTIAVDPGQSVTVDAFGQITDDARITAHAGTVTLANEQNGRVVDGANPQTAALSLSVFVGADAAIDVSGTAALFADNFGRNFGTITPGGTIVLGADLGLQPGSLFVQNANDAAVVVAQGATLNANGAAGTIDLLAGSTPQLAALQQGPVARQPVTVNTPGGEIALRSDSAIDILGTLTAAAGGSAATGGLLSVTLENPLFTPLSQGGAFSVPTALQVPRVVTLSDTPLDVLGGAVPVAGSPLPIGAYGQANVSQQLISAGGFGALSVFSRDIVAFDGSVALSLPVSVSIAEGTLVDTAASGAVTVTAPYVALSGFTAATSPQGGQITSAILNWHPFDGTAGATFSVQSDLLDISDQLRFGISSTYSVTPPGGTISQVAYNAPGFSLLDFHSNGDIRFDPGFEASAFTPGSPAVFNATSLTTPGNIVFQANQLYPTTGANVLVEAGFNIYDTGASNTFLPYGSITILSNGGPAPSVPYSVGGIIQFAAGNIIQGGVVRAPDGEIALGATGAPPGGSSTSFSDQVVLLPGSVTSISQDGLTIPYGGTVDGVTYSYNGAAISQQGFLSGTFSGIADTSGYIQQPVVVLAGQVTTIDAGALLDLSGGGTLAGAGFITGRGGSTNVLTSPLFNFSGTGGVTIPTLAQDPVYAIVPGYASGYAPLTPVEIDQSAGAVPGIGSQITIGSAVPGIAAGTYTLLPSYYALLPGAARIQINTGAFDSVPGTISLGAGSYEFNATTGLANTGTVNALPVEVIATTAAGVALNSEYDTQTYSQFQLASASQFGLPPLPIPEDGKALEVLAEQPLAGVSALTNFGTANFAAASGGYGGQVWLNATGAYSPTIEITANGVAAQPGATGIDASALDAFHAPRLVIGGILVTDDITTNRLDVIASAGSVTVDSGATLSGPEVLLTATSANGIETGAVTVATGATVSTVGQGAPIYDTPSSGYYYYADGNTVTALSNGRLIFLPEIGASADGVITVASGANLFTSGTLSFSTSQGLSLSASANYGAADLFLNVANINIVSDADLAAQQAGTLVLPSGVILPQSVVNALIDGNPAAGTAPLQDLVLTASQSFNFAGTVSLNTINPATGQSTLSALVINTPAIYGYGGSTDAATISAGTIYWDGVLVPPAFTSGSPVSASPGGIVANGPGTGSGTLNLDAQTIVLGAGPDTQPNDQITLDRLTAGFATVNLNASESLTANNQSALAVYQSVPNYGQAGTGGTLNIVTPVVTGAAGSVSSLTAGSAITLSQPAGATVPASGALGATLNLTATTITDDGAILLNAGRVTMTASDGLTLGGGATIDVAGVATQLVDQTEYTPGGSVVLSSAGGSLSTAAGSAIDIGSLGAAAGSLSIIDLTGTVALAGGISGSAAAGQSGGGFVLQAGTLAAQGSASGFDALNAALDAGGLYGSRSFELATGDIAVDGTVTARSVTISADAGAIDVTGTIDASGPAPGRITLAAADTLTVATGAVLDAKGTVLQTDSTGAPIGSENRGVVSLTSTNGTLVLGDATIDVSSPDPAALGQVWLYAPRTTANGVENGVAISAAGPVSIIGAEDIWLYGSRTYIATDANGTVQQSATGLPAGGVAMDSVNADNAAFINAAAANGALATATAGLSAYGAAYALLPADIIQSVAGGNLTVTGDINLVGYRYGPNAGTTVGAGLPGQLTLRAANNLIVNGSISDGFATPPDQAAPTPDDNGWVLYANEPANAAVTLPQNLPAPISVTSATFSNQNTVALNYNVSLKPATLNANVVYPTNVVTQGNYILASPLVVTANILAPKTGAILVTAGTLLPAGYKIPSGATLTTGTLLPFAVSVQTITTWPAGAPLSDFSGSVSLNIAKGSTFKFAGGDYIPSGTTLKFSGNVKQVSLRAENAAGEQGYIYATAPLLPAGSQSWSLNLVGGANLGAADVLSVEPASGLAGLSGASTDGAGSIVLADTHYTLAAYNTSKGSGTASESFSVVRTGTGFLNLVAGGNVDEASAFGVYTAGAQTSLSAAQNAAFNPPRATQADGTILGPPGKNLNYAPYDAIDASQVANYPDGGGDVFIAAGNDITGEFLGSASKSFSEQTAPSDNVGNWLWRQGGGATTGSAAQPASWWINFGSYVIPLTAGGQTSFSATLPALVGFTGFGTLGGGNLNVVAGGNVGMVSSTGSSALISQGVDFAVASTGRVTGVDTSGGAVTGGSTVLTGGGTVTLDVAGAINPSSQSSTATGADGGGTITDLRGNVTVDAGQIGLIDLTYVPQTLSSINSVDPRAIDPFAAEYASETNGIALVLGDGSANVTTQRDLVLEGAGDPTRLAQQALTAAPGGAAGVAVDSGFSLWTPTTAIRLFSSGGNLDPVAITNGLSANIGSPGTFGGLQLNDLPSDYREIYPGTLIAVAASGSFYYGTSVSITNNIAQAVSLELAPSPVGQLAFIAANSIYGNGYAVDMSGASDAPSALPNPYNPAYAETSGGFVLASNIQANVGNPSTPASLFAFEPDTPTGNLHANDTVPELVYAATGDIVAAQFGEIINYLTTSGETDLTWYIAAKPIDIYAGRDIVSSGTQPAVYATGYAPSAFGDTPNQRTGEATGAITTGDLFLNTGANSVSSVTAGRDILGSYFYVAGPGTLEVTAGRNINDTSAQSGSGHLAYGAIRSLGPIVNVTAANQDSGASLAITTGAGAAGPDYTAFAELYFNNANQANLALPITAPQNQGKVQQTYENQLLAWMQQNYGYAGPESGVLAAFLALPVPQQAVFVREVFYTELNASGLQYSDPTSLFFKSYQRGQQAIATLFPDPGTYSGSLTMDSGFVAQSGGDLQNPVTGANVVFDAGISTLFGGSVQMLSPGGSETYGSAAGQVPGTGTGIITEGTGNIDIYALDNVLLGQSRIFTTFGGSILIWSAAGNINAGQGAKTTVVVPPPLIQYDSYGDVTLSPPVPSSGAGIATLAPIAGVAPGNVNLVAPLGTVDAGAAGIRVSGNLNIAAVRVVNAANIQVGGKTTGNTATIAINTSAASAAASAAGATTDAATAAAAASGASKALAQQPSIITVEALGSDDASTDTRRKPAS